MVKSIKTENSAARHWAGSIKSIFKGAPAPQANPLAKLADTPHDPQKVDIIGEMAELNKDYEKLARRLSYFTNSFTGQFMSAQKEIVTLRAKSDIFARECEKSQNDLTSAKSRENISQMAFDQVRATEAIALTKLSRALGEISDTKEHLSAARHRNESLSNDYACLLQDFDNLRNELFNGRVELEDSAAFCSQLESQLDQSRRKESDLDASMQLISVEVENYRFEVNRTRQEVGQRSKQILNLESELSSLRAGLSNIEADRDAIRAERDRLSADKEKLECEIEDISRTSDAKIVGLSKAKTFLATALETVRKQANEHLRRISQLEQSNSALSRISNHSKSHYDVVKSDSDDAHGRIVADEKIVKMTG